MSEWDFQWEEVHPSERKTSQVSAEVGGGGRGGASPSRICCLPVLLAPKGHKELGNAEQWAGGECDANKSSYSQIFYPHGLRITEFTAS